MSIFEKALDKLSDPIAIIALLLMVMVIVLVCSITRHLPRIYKALGKQTAILNYIFYNQGNNRKDD